MAEAKLTIGTRNFRVACEDGQEGYLQSAAALLDQFAKTLMQNNADISENQMLLMSGLMAADQAKAGERENMKIKSHHKDLETRLSRIESKTTEAIEEARNESKKELDETKSRLAEAQKDSKAAEAALEVARNDLGRLEKEKLEAIENGQKQSGSSENEEKLTAELNQAKAQIGNLQNELRAMREAKEKEAKPQSDPETQKKVEALDTSNQRLRQQLMRKEYEMSVMNDKLQATLSESKEKDARLAEMNSAPAQSAAPSGFATDGLIEDLITGLERLAEGDVSKST